MNVVVCVKQIPDPAEPGALDPDHTLKRDGKLILDESDSLRRRDGAPARRQGRRRRGHPRLDGPQQRVTAACAPPSPWVPPRPSSSATTPSRAPAPSTPPRCSPRPSSAAEFDLVLAATESSDGYTGTVPEQIAELLGLPSVTFAKHIEIDGATVKVQRQTEAGYDEVECPLPAVVSVTAGVVEPRYPSFKGIMAAKSKPVDEVDRRRPRPRRRHRRLGRRRPGDRRRRRTPRSARPARSSRTTARASQKIVAFLENLKVDLSMAASPTIWVFAEADGRQGDDRSPSSCWPRPATLGDTVEAVYGGDGARRRRGARRPRRHQGARHRRPRRAAARRRRRLGDRRAIEAADAPTSSCSAPPTTAATSPPACRSSSTSRCSPTTSTSPSTATPSSPPTPIFGGTTAREHQVHRRRPVHRARPARSRSRPSSPAAARPRSRRSPCPTPAPPAPPRSPTATSRSTPVPSSTRPPSSSPAAVASARPTSTR